MARFTIKTESPQKKIEIRIMELFKTEDDLKKLFNSILPKNSLLKSILKIDKIQNKEEVCDILLSYLGDNFFVYVGKVRPDSDDDDDDDVIKTKTENIQYNSKIDPTHIVREKFLEQICIYKGDNHKLRQKIINDFNNEHPSEVTTLKEVSQHKEFLSKKWPKDLCNKVLLLPDIIVEKPETEPQLPETIALRKKSHLPRLYDFQTEALIKIHNMLNNAQDTDGRQKRLLVNLPTGAGKTRMTVQAIIEWLNFRDQGKSKNAHEQQKNPNGLIFWLASTNELCTQASDSFQQLFDHLGTAGQINLTNWYGTGRRDLRHIRDDKPGTHIVITNTQHTNNKFKFFSNKDAGRFRFDWYKDSPELEEIRKNTIAIIIDEAHEVTGDGYQDFLAAMGFDLNKDKRGLERKIYNTQNIVLIGLTATPYKGSGITNWYKCQTCKEIFKNKTASNTHKKGKITHNIKQIKPFMEDEFLDQNDSDPSYYDNLDTETRKIHKTFGGVYLPIPHKSILDSRPVIILDVPQNGYVDDSIKISGSNSYDQYSELKFIWKISTFEKIVYESEITSERKSDEPEFYFAFPEEGDYSISLTITNAKNVSSHTETRIKISPKEKSRIKGIGDLADTKEFYDILTNDQKILCKITHGVIEGPQIKLTNTELKNGRWER